MRSNSVAVVAASALVAVVALVAPATARAQDGGPCILDGGTIDGVGKCDQNDAVFCGSDDTLQRLHCPALPITDTLTLSGGLCDDTTDFGAWCSFPPATTCAFLDGAGNPLNFMCGTSPTDDTNNLVCDVDDGCTDVSASDVGFCVAGFSGPRCVGGQHVRVDCTPWGDDITLDCTKHAGNCVEDQNAGTAKCVNGLNGECDQDGALFACASGLECRGATADAFGTCHNPNDPVDAGQAPPVDSGVAPDAGQQQQPDAGQQRPDAGQAAPDAGVVTHDAGTQPSEGEGEGEGNGGGGGISLGDTPDAGDVTTEPPQSGCGCSSSPTGSALAVFGAVALAFVARRRRAR